MDLAEKLYTVRKLISLNQREAAEKAGLKQATISIIERGERNSLPNDYLEFLHSKGIDLNWLFGTENDVALAFRGSTFSKQPVNFASNMANLVRTDEKLKSGTMTTNNIKASGEIMKNFERILGKLLQEIEQLNSTLLMIR